MGGTIDFATTSLLAATSSYSGWGDLIQHPVGIFALLVAITVLVPPLFRRLGLPDLVGLLVAGVIAGPHLLGWLQPEGETINLLSDIGAIYLLFTVGLEIDLEEFQRVRNRSMAFGLLSFLIGSATGIAIGWWFNFPLIPCLLLGALMASHTPLGYPIVRSYGAQRDESVIVSVGGTILTDIASLLLRHRPWHREGKPHHFRLPWTFRKHCDFRPDDCSGHPHHWQASLDAQRCR